MVRHVAALLAAALMVAGGVAVSVSLAGNHGGGYTISTMTVTTGGGHTPVTICHKPGTPAEMTLVVDDDAVPGHLGHGDYLGECQPPVTTTGTTGTTTGTSPTQTTPTMPQLPRCPPGQGPFAGKDGQPGNNECCPDSNNDQQCDQPTPPPTNPSAPPSTGTPVTPQSTTTPPLTTKVMTKPLAKPKPDAKPRTTTTHKAAKTKPPKLTGNPKVDKCKDLQNGTMRCKGIVVTLGNG